MLKGMFYVLMSQVFWKFISGGDDAYEILKYEGKLLLLGLEVASLVTYAKRS